jgi:hypothetical protein
MITKIDTFLIKKNEIQNHLPFFTKLYNENMYASDGVLKDVWRRPDGFIREEAYLSVLTYEENIASLLFLPKSEWYGWNRHIKRLNETYGLIGFYTKPQFCRKGFAKSLFNKFDKEVHIRKIASSGNANNIISEVNIGEKICI